MRFFEFTVRRLHFLARIPGLPQLFDAILLLWTALWHRPRLRAMEALEAAACQLPGTVLRTHRFGGTGFVFQNRELGHLHGNGLLDVRLGRVLARASIAEQKALPHHVFGDSAWVSYWLRSEADLPGAIALLKAAHSGEGTFQGHSSPQ